MRHAKKYLPLISYLICVVCFIITIITCFNRSITKPFKIPIVIASILIAIVLLQHTFKRRSALINVITSIALVISCFAVNVLQTNRDSLFVEPAKTSEMHVNFYVMSSSYRSAHSNTFETTDPSNSLSDYIDQTFILQEQFDQDDQATALEDIENFMEVDSLQTITLDTVYEAIEALYQGKGDVLVLNQSFVSRIKQIAPFMNFDDDTFILHTITIGNSSTPEVTSIGTSAEPFICYIAGNDTRNDALTLVGRTDMDMIMTVDPANKQILLISIPRDYYIENPALENGLDKLTHLGNHGIQNTLNGINQYFSLEINSYLETNFTHFVDLIDSLGGITINNPYAFTCENAGDYSFEAGVITLNGDEALAYARERYSLENGDFDRNEHQTIIMQGILEKIQQVSDSEDLTSLFTTLASDFLTNLNLNDIFIVYKSTLSSEQSWSIIKYHLGGEGTYASTASLGSKEYYVCKPFASQVQFTNEMVNKVLNGEIITEEALPDADLTTYIDN